MWVPFISFPLILSLCHVSVVLDSPLDFSLDDCVEYIQEDELVEITPLSVRMCKNPKLSKKGK